MNKKLLVALFLSLGSLSAIGMNNQYAYVPNSSNKQSAQQPNLVAQPVAERISRDIKAVPLIKSKLKQFAASILAFNAVNSAVLGSAGMIGAFVAGFSDNCDLRDIRRKAPFVVPILGIASAISLAVAPAWAAAWLYVEKSAQKDLRDEYISSYFNIEHPTQLALHANG